MEEGVHNTGKYLYRDELPGGAHWSLRIKRGHILRFTDLEGGANIGVLFFNPSNYLERYNAPDTLKCQHTFKLTAGNCLYSDMGRIFCSVISDSVGWHDTVCGNSNEKTLRQRWDVRSYQDHHNDWTLNGNDSFLVELAKYGMGKRDMAANLNLFSKVDTDDLGNMHFDADNSQPGDYIDLRFEMDTLVVFHTCPHPMNNADSYPKKPIAYEFYKADEVAEDDYCKTLCAENGRGFENTNLYNVLQA
jgi:uncharacterized protein